jgi:hypothetical protein
MAAQVSTSERLYFLSGSGLVRLSTAFEFYLAPGGKLYLPAVAIVTAGDPGAGGRDRRPWPKGLALATWDSPLYAQEKAPKGGDVAPVGSPAGPGPGGPGGGPGGGGGGSNPPPCNDPGPPPDIYAPPMDYKACGPDATRWFQVELSLWRNYAVAVGKLLQRGHFPVSGQLTALARLGPLPLQRATRFVSPSCPTEECVDTVTICDTCLRPGMLGNFRQPFLRAPRACAPWGSSTPSR